jgi:lysine 2,3-aminomutase
MESFEKNYGAYFKKVSSFYLKDHEKGKIKLTKNILDLSEKNHSVALQFLPSNLEEDPKSLPKEIEELSLKIYNTSKPWSDDPIGDLKNLVDHRITHRYQNRVLIHLTKTCAVNCRFCFRKSEILDPEEKLYQGNLEHAYYYVQNHKEINEVIFTGGDPLILKNEFLEKTFNLFLNLNHILTIRIHSKIPSVYPERITSNFCEMLKNLIQKHKKNIVLVTHINHPDEITSDVQEKIFFLRQIGLMLLNQSVLLRNINDNSQTLLELFEKLYSIGIKPYYCHYPDWAKNTFGFRSGIEKAKKIFSNLAGLLSGPAMPKLMLDIPHGFGKIDLMNTENIFLVQSLEIENFRADVYEIKQNPKTKKEEKINFYLDIYYSN